MKSKIALLLIVIGGVIGSISLSAFDDNASILLVAVLGGFLIGFSMMLFTSIYSGTVWGIKIKSEGLSKAKTAIGAVGLAFGGFSLVVVALYLFVSLFQAHFIPMIITLVLYLVFLAIGPMVAKVFLEKTLAKEHSADVLGQFPIFNEIDENLANATNFVVGFEGVALYSNTNYCYAVYLWEDYQLGELTSPSEVALVGTYFVQKYNDKYTFKVDVEVIPGTPGQTVVAVGNGGIGVARIQGTPDQRLFRSYIFKRK